MKQLTPEQLMLGKLVQEWRQGYGLSQGKFVDELGMTLLIINRWEPEYAAPSALALKQRHSLLQPLGDRGEALQTLYFSEGKSTS